jgi:hypothetical protein
VGAAGAQGRAQGHLGLEKGGRHRSAFDLKETTSAVDWEQSWDYLRKPKQAPPVASSQGTTSVF